MGEMKAIIILLFPAMCCAQSSFWKDGKLWVSQDPKTAQTQIFFPIEIYLLPMWSEVSDSETGKRSDNRGDRGSR